MNQTKNSQFLSSTQEGKMTAKLLLILSLATIFLPQNIKGQEFESNVDQGNSSRGIVKCSGAALSVVWVHLGQFFLYFNLKN